MPSGKGISCRSSAGIDVVDERAALEGLAIVAAGVFGAIERQSSPSPSPPDGTSDVSKSTENKAVASSTNKESQKEREREKERARARETAV